ncbi:hypothetical protein PRUPE_3G222100 [Prunus persica]|uniref:Glabrous enhancer-binding protein-like DBD domain-containing protein n=1 Tax=Prunus persica TaxID=3760 RepID=A0A251Q790_PRUPE|nr:STOREKEEPER protein [Prunus persica]ONI18545.1 hypothetical protein PRUPE_3G222100 [Prunus persica]
MAQKKLLDDPPVVEDSDEETVDEETVDEEELEEEDDAVEAEDGKAKSGDDNHDGDEEEGEEDADEEDEDEEDNEEKKEKALLTSSSAVSNSNPQWPSASEDDSGSGSETESENNSQSPSASEFTIKPVVSKPMNDPVKPNKKNAPAKPAPASNSGSKRPETELNKKNAPSSSNSGSKRRAETEPNPKDSKKKKVVNSGDDDDGKKGRLWSEDDEIAILKGMIEYQVKNGPVTNSTMGAFHEFIKKKLQVDVSKLQLSDKIRRLKMKYQKKGENGEDPVFSKPHEVKSFDLSKKVWSVEANGVDDNAKDSKRKPRKSSKVDKATVLALPVSDVAEKKEELNVANGGIKADPVDFWSKYPCLSGSLGLDNSTPRSDLTTLMVQKMPLIGKSKAKELEGKWRALQLIEMELSVKKLALMQEQAKFVLDSMKSSED